MSKKILVIEDEEDLRDIIFEYLVDSGFQVKALPDGKNVDLVVEEFRPDLVICDYGLPGRNGLEIISQIQSKLHTERISFFILSGHAKDSVPGIPDNVPVLEKPFSEAALIQQVNDSLLD